MRQAIVDEVDRRLVERQDINTAFIRGFMANGFRSVDDRFRLAKEFNEQISKAATDLLGIALTASNEAVKKAEQAVEKRFDSVNEFRQSLSDLSNQMIQRTEAITMVGAANGNHNIGSRLDRMTGADHKGQTSTTTTISIAAVIIATIVGGIAFLSFERTTTPTPICTCCPVHRTSEVSGNTRMIRKLGPRLGTSITLSPEAVCEIVNGPNLILKVGLQKTPAPSQPRLVTGSAHRGCSDTDR